MLTIVLVCLVLVADDGAKPPAKGSPDRAAYETAASKAGRDANSHVQLALWCEQHGMTAERVKHLAAAVLYDPSNALARGLMGLVSYNGKWERPADVSREAKDDPRRRALMEEYLQRRAKTPETADAHFKLATWCDQNGLKPQAAAHFQRVIRLDPRREAAWRHLGFKKSGGRWVKPESVALAKARAQEQQKADKHWKPILERYRSALQSKSPSRRGDAEQALAKITEPDAVPMVWATFGRAEPALQTMAVQVLGQIDDGSASRSLVLLAVFGGSADVRSRAIATLRRRDAREFASMLIGMILEPIEYEVKRVQGPGQGGELLIKGQGSAPNLKRLYSPPAAPSIPLQPGDRVIRDENGLPVIFRPEIYSTTPYSPVMGRGANVWNLAPQPMAPAQFKAQITGMLNHSGLGAQAQSIGRALMTAYQNQISTFNNPYLSPNSLLPMVLAVLPDNGLPVGTATFVSITFAMGESIPVGQMAMEAQKTAAVAQQQLENDVAAIKQYNQGLNEINDRVLPVLRDISGLDIGPKPVEWQKWYVNLIGYQLNQLQKSENPTVIEDVPLAYQPQPIPIGQMTAPVAASRISCFGAGTLVRTLTGLEPIETLKVGDSVLTQSTKTGVLSYKPILAVHHNPPSKTFRVKLGGETIVSSEFHRFWKAGSGWVMARDLKEENLIRTLNGPAAVTSIEQGDVVLVYNLDVAEDSDFFVGRGGALVHDNTLPDLREKPFDAAGPAVAEAPTARPRSMLGR
jgi:tetratricopeptide (TPR) repeat protein